MDSRVHSIDPRRRAEPRSVAGLLGQLGSDLVAGRAAEVSPVPTGFDPLDRALGGGLRAGELTTVGGAPGVGKTIATLQWARAIARRGGTAVYACYEHDESALLMRLIGLEIGSLPSARDGEELERLREALRRAAESRHPLDSVLAAEPLARRAYDEIETYADRLWLVRGSPAHTGVEALQEMVAIRRNEQPVLFVDYLQKVAGPPGQSDTERHASTAEDLKDLAMAARIPVVCVVAADEAGLAARRLRLHQLTGAAALAYESDVILLLNEKFNCVSKAHLAYDALRAKSFHEYTVVTIEKNRSGPALLNIEFRKDFGYFRFDDRGGLVRERLVDDVLTPE